MNLGGVAAIDDLDGLLHALDEADAALRALYRQLADNPDLASENESKLRELHAKRLDLAQRVGLAVLARKRASAHVDEGG
jgi:predicted Zn-dependent protease